MIAHDGWKMLTDEEQITNRLLKRNRTHLSMSGDTPFARGPLTDIIGRDGEGVAVEEMLKGTFIQDTTGLDEVHASKEMKAFSCPQDTNKQNRW